MNTNDLSLGFDPTNQTSITGAQLASLITTAYPSSDRGMCLFTTDDAFGTPNVPNATTNPVFARYIWIRVQTATNGFSVYIWNPAALGGTAGPYATSLLYWNPIALGIIPPGSITNSQLAGAITYDKITSVAISSILNNNQLVQLTTPVAGGIITGTIGASGGGLTIAPGVVDNTMLASDTNANSPDAAVSTNNIVGGSVLLSKLDRTGSSGYFLTAQGAGQAPIWSSLGTVKLLQTVVQDTLGVTVNPAGTSGAGNQLILSAAPGFKLTAANPGIVTAVGSASSYQTGLPCSNGSNAAKVGGPALAVSITPKSLSSYLLVRISLSIYLSQADQVTLSLYSLGSASAGSLPSATASAGVVTFNNNGGNASVVITPLPNAGDNGQAIALFNCVSGYNRIDYSILISIAGANPSLVYPSVIFPFIGCANASTAIGFNSSSSSSATPLYGGGIFQSYMIVQEILL